MKKLWNYFMQIFDHRTKGNANPKVQIRQSLEKAQYYHKKLIKHAFSILGDQKHIEDLLNKKQDEVDNIDSQVKQSLEIAKKSRGQGDEKKAQEYEQVAEKFSATLTVIEQYQQKLHLLYEETVQLVNSAQQNADETTSRLRQQINEQSRFLSKSDQVNMQKKITKSIISYGTENIPSLDEV